MFIPLKRKFYKRYCLDVAEEILGKYLVKNDSDNLLVGKIVEVEAYDGSIDEASHSYCGITNRNRVMFNEGGYLYVYLSYGIHFCANIVTGNKNEGQAVLIRAVEPVVGIEKMSINRFGHKAVKDFEFYNLTNGPGKVCKALEINLTHNGIDICGNKIFIVANRKSERFEIMRTERIGINKSRHLKWRFYIKNNRFVSNTKK